MRPSVSVVIPTLDEEQRLPSAIQSVRADADVIVVDGGSGDATREVAAREGARVLEAPRGRGRQLDQGARAATGEWLLFLHADTRLETGWADALAALPPEVVGGAFRFAVDSPRPAFRVVERAVRLRLRLFALPYGDQGLFVRREVYARIGGVPHLPLMEDVAFVARLRRAGRLAFPPVRAFTSARRWDRYGIVGTTLRNWSLLARYAAGQSPERLARRYGRS
ncbi:MAG TPA: TIGR04283 family arsenosugar biosynthesis glycosyltransferase [Vicinamibacteria bacterium]|nr:TIGR04283 family arsenosugar biosynthesis glycosyltransferase [Vicinamibacteria bacterium]